MESHDKFEIISEIAKRRGFFWLYCEIYGGVSGFVTFGPLGSILKRKIEDKFRDFFFRRLGLYEIESPTIVPGKVFEASGHVDHFKEPMVECNECKRRFRADHLLQELAGMSETETDKFSLQDLRTEMDRHGIRCLECGGEFGEEWHKAGMLENRQNVFDDFIAAAEWLIENNYTNPSKFAIAGGSNGGLLVGAALIQRPELFQTVVCTYPLLDMIRYHKFMVARFWVSEYGSSEDPDQFKYIHAYSPYHNVTPGTEYPSVLFITGDSDTRVAPLHARKMTALLQSATASDKPVLLLYDTKAGHSGGRPLSKQIEDETDEMSFLFWQLGMKFK